MIGINVMRRLSQKRKLKDLRNYQNINILDHNDLYCREIC